jgi:hypothetical protein
MEAEVTGDDLISDPVMCALNDDLPSPQTIAA